MPNQYDNIDKEYLIQVIKFEMEKLGYTNDNVMVARIYNKIIDAANNPPTSIIMPSFEPTEKYVMSDEDIITMRASGQYDCDMQGFAYIKWAMEVK